MTHPNDWYRVHDDCFIMPVPGIGVLVQVTTTVSQYDPNYDDERDTGVSTSTVLVKGAAVFVDKKGGASFGGRAGARPPTPAAWWKSVHPPTAGMVYEEREESVDD